MNTYDTMRLVEAAEKAASHLEALAFSLEHIDSHLARTNEHLAHIVDRLSSIDNAMPIP